MSARAPDIASKPGTIVDLFVRATAEGGSPYARSYREGAFRDTTRAELAAQVERVARGLMSFGIGRGDRVALLCQTRPEWTACDFAIQCAGASVIPIYPTSSPDECRHVLADSGASAIVCEDTAQVAKIEQVRASLRSLAHVFVVDAGGAPEARSLAVLEGLGAEHAAGEPEAFRRRIAEVDPADPCTIVYTSGTTGPPKGCVILQRNYRAMTEMAAAANSFIRPGATVYLFLPLAHVFARLAQYQALAGGATLIYTRGVDRIAEDLAETRPQILPSVPRIFEKVHHGVVAHAAAAPALRRRIFDWAIGVGEDVSRLTERGRSPGRALAARHALADRVVLSKVRARLGGRLEVCISGGAPIAPEILRFFHACGLLVLEGYGLSESSTAISINRREAFRFGTVGKVMEGGEVRIADDGEVLFRGPNVFAGYHGQPRATAEAIVDGWLHTGDIGSLDPDGFLHLTDRKKDIIVTSGGKNVTPANVENALKTSPYIAEAILVGDRRPYVVALIALDHDEIGRYGAAHGLGEDPAALVAHPQIQELVAAKVAAVNETLTREGQVRRFRVLDAAFSQETGELTPTLKLKRRVVATRYAGVIDELYAEARPVEPGRDAG